MYATAFPAGGENLDHLKNELARFHPAEALLSAGAWEVDGLRDFLKERLDCPCENGGEGRFRPDVARALAEKQFQSGLDGLGAGEEAAVQAAAAFVSECIRQTPEGTDERLGVWLEASLPKLMQQ